MCFVTKPSCGDYLVKAGQTGPVIDTFNGEYVVWGCEGGR